MRPAVGIAVAAALAGLALGGAMTWSVRRDAARWEQRRAELQAWRTRMKKLEERVVPFEAAWKATRTRRELVLSVREDQEAVVALLSALGEGLDARIGRVSASRVGGEISGRADSPVAANEVGESLAARGLVADYDLRRFDSGAFTLAFALPRKQVGRR